MEKTEGTAKIGLAESMAVGLDQGFPGALYRVAIGYAVLPGLMWLRGKQGSEWMVVPALLAVLALLKMLPMVFRRLLPFSAATKEVWAGRRQMAKRYDSYQWQKLFWIGAGLTLYSAASHEFGLARIVVCSFCLLTGALGLARWRAVWLRRVASTLPARGGAPAGAN